MALGMRPKRFTWTNGLQGSGTVPVCNPEQAHLWCTWCLHLGGVCSRPCWRLLI